MLTVVREHPEEYPLALLRDVAGLECLSLAPARLRCRILAMAKTFFNPGDKVATPRTIGTVVDVRPTPSGQFIFGVEDSTGEIAYFTPKALKEA